MAIGRKRDIKEDGKEQEEDEEQEQEEQEQSYFYGDDDIVDDKTITSGLITDAPEMPKNFEERQKWKRLVVILEAATLHTLKKVHLAIQILTLLSFTH